MKLLAVAVLALWLAGCAGDEESGSINSTEFITEVESWDGVQDVALSDDRRVYVAMFDNGSKRDGYAMSVCEELRSYSSGDLKPRRITIIDAAKQDEFTSLGKHRCEF